MKTILLLNDEIGAARLQLISAAPDPTATRPSKGSLGCNCDRWGHPCPGCLDHDIVPKAETTVSSPVKR